MGQLAHDALVFWSTVAVVLLLLGAVALPFGPRIADGLIRLLGSEPDDDWPEGFEDEPG